MSKLLCRGIAGPHTASTWISPHTGDIVTGSKVGLEGVLLAVTQAIITKGTFELAIGGVGHISRKSLVRCFPQRGNVNQALPGIDGTHLGRKSEGI
jgi:hypothetical protein